MIDYSVKALDTNGDEISWDFSCASNKKDAIKRAKEMLHDQELIDIELHTVQVLDINGECVWDAFV